MTQDYFSTHKLCLAIAVLLLLPILLLSLRLQAPWGALLALVYALFLAGLCWRTRCTLRQLQMDAHE